MSMQSPGTGIKARTALYALTLGMLGAAYAFSAAPQNAAVNLQKRCFCVRPTKNPYQPYEIIKFPTEKACKGESYRTNNKAPWDNGILSCEDMKECAKMQRSCKTKAGKIEKSILKLQSRIVKCQDEACSAPLQQKLTKLMADLASHMKKCAAFEKRCFGERETK